MDRTQKTILTVIAVLLALALIAALVWGAWYLRQRKKFSPPPFEAAAVEGEPTVSADRGFVYADLWEGLRVGLCGKGKMDGDDLSIYFSSPATNTAWIKVKVYDEDGTLLGESGLLRPGEYVERVALSSRPSGETAKLKVLSYEPETYYSLGAAETTIEVK